ncbi:hypothetical protein MKX01_001018 [Papaver californicum]|nr:hypothetical protein MKX01_001018 [Papaver californicum]
MCDRALPGERFIGRVTRKKGNYAEVQKSKTITPHKDLVDAPFEYASACGGCKTQNLLYEAQVRAKEQQVHELVIHVGKFIENDPEFANVMKPIVPCDIQFNYRNKVSIINNVNTSVGNTSVGEAEYILYGKSSISEVLRGITFQISANSFFKTNTYQAEVLYRLIEECAGLRGDGSEVVLDLFCGTGTIGLTLAKKVKHVYGYEMVPQSISDARRNAENNGISNATFIQGDLNKISDNFGDQFPRPDIVISDPNRPGMHLKLIKYLLKLRAPRLIYVSCNPATCARDLDYLCHGLEEKNIKGCYKLKSLQPVDMFPHTPPIECVCLLELE